MAWKSDEERRAYHRAYYKKYNEANREKINEYSRNANDKPARQIKNKEYSENYKNDGRRRASKLRVKYNLSIEEYDLLLVKQNNVCACCENPETYKHPKTKEIRRLVVDHCHKTGKVRGLLCTQCNLMLGNSKDSIEILEKAIDYLKTNINE